MADKLDSFDDDAIRIELRRIVEDVEARILGKFAATEDDIRAANKAPNDFDEEHKRKVYSEIEAGKSEVRRKFQMMLDFIDRQ